MNKSTHLENRTAKSACDICVEPRTFIIQERALFCLASLQNPRLYCNLAPVYKGFGPCREQWLGDTVLRAAGLHLGGCWSHTSSSIPWPTQEKSSLSLRIWTMVAPPTLWLMTVTSSRDYRPFQSDQSIAVQSPTA